MFERAGLQPAHAATVADALLWANLRGVDSHGALRIPAYAAWIESGDTRRAPRLRVESETAASVLIDADQAAGPVAMQEGMRQAVRKAREAAIGLAVVRGTTHTAALGYYTSAAATEGMAAIALSASAPNMAYHGAAAAGVSTGPISIAVPGERAPLVLDMASAAISNGKLMQARRTGEPIGLGLALDRDGRPTTDARAAHMPLPIGGAKGSGLSLMIECLTSLLAAKPIIAPKLAKDPQARGHWQNGTLIAIDVARFGDAAAFRREVERLVKAIKALPRAPGSEEILVPGERAARTLARRSREGIPLPQAVVEELNAVAKNYGVEMPGGS